MAPKRQMNPKDKPDAEKGDRLARRGTGGKSQNQALNQHSSRIPSQDAFQNIPKRKAPSHLEANRAGPSPKPMNENVAVEGNKPKSGKQSPERERREPRQKGPPSPAVRRKRKRLLLTVIMLMAVGGGFWFSFNVLFPIQTFTIQGDTQYSTAEILQAVGLAEGDNLLSFSLAEAEERLLSELPYLEKAEVRRQLPETVILRLTPATETYCFPWEDGWAIMSESQRVLRFDTEQPQGVTAIYGLTGISVEVGQKLVEGEADTGYAYSYEEYQALMNPPSEEPVAEVPPEEAAAAEVPPEEAAAAEVPPEAAAAEVPPEEAAAAEVPPEAAAAEVPPEEAAAAEVLPEEAAAAEVPLEEAAESLPEEIVSSSSVSSGGETSDVASQVEEEGPVVSELVSFESLLQQLADMGFSQITWIDISDPLNIRFRWEDRITVQLGAYNHMQEKLEFVAALMLDPETGQIMEGDRGVVDASGYPVSTDRIWFTPD